MTLRPCPQEEEIRGLLDAGRWPLAAAPELLTHAESCRSCGEVVLVATSFRSARAVAAQSAQLPSAGVIFFRAQLRQRNAAIERINRPILWAQAFAFAVVLLVAAGIAISQAGRELQWFAGWGSRFASRSQSPAFHWDLSRSFNPLGSIFSGLGLSTLLPAVAMLVLLGGVVVYLAAEKQ